ncbi:MAG: DUF1449 family protein [Planctomycetota bacterium]|nr:DUF1449 family protein [Planctomycetaceae bacterium]MDQ3329318.1 DUF1449 family protein [Planctomycetota bacterium]
MSEIIDLLFAIPTLPGTILLGVCLVYWLLLIAGAVSLDLLHIDLDLDTDVNPDAAGTSWGMTAFKFLNINDVPLMIWLSIFAAAYVAIAGAAVSIRPVGDDLGAIAAAIACSSALALIATKLLTQPLRGKFEVVEPNVAETLVGRTCVITTVEVSERFGQASVESEGAPLLLNVRAPAETLSKHDVAVITGFDRDRNVFFVEPVAAVPSEPPTREAV